MSGATGQRAGRVAAGGRSGRGSGRGRGFRGAGGACALTRCAVAGQVLFDLVDECRSTGAPRRPGARHVRRGHDGTAEGRGPAAGERRSRGLLDTSALVRQVRAGRLRGALDVTGTEPLPPGHPCGSCQARWSPARGGVHRGVLHDEHGSPGPAAVPPRAGRGAGQRRSDDHRRRSRRTGSRGHDDVDARPCPRVLADSGGCPRTTEPGRGWSCPRPTRPATRISPGCPPRRFLRGPQPARRRRRRRRRARPRRPAGEHALAGLVTRAADEPLRVGTRPFSGRRSLRRRGERPAI